MLDIIRPVYNNDLWGKGIPNSRFHSKIPNILFLHLIKYIDKKHAKINKITCREILNWIQINCAVYCSKHTLLKFMIDIG